MKGGIGNYMYNKIDAILRAAFGRQWGDNPGYSKEIMSGHERKKK